jgi:hypothetical protein
MDLETSCFLLSGLFFLALGALVLMDRTLSICGNILIAIGVALYLRGNMKWIDDRHKLLGMLLFFLGAVLSFRSILLGLFLEILGLSSLFSGRLGLLRFLAKRSLHVVRSKIS